MKRPISQEAASRQEHGFRARMKTPGGRRVLRPAALTAQEAHGLTRTGGHNPPRLVMLSRPEDFEALQGEGTVRSNSLLVVRFEGPVSRKRASAYRPDAKLRRSGGPEQGAQATP